MDKILWVGAGGCAGAIARYLVSNSIQYIAKGIAFPWGTYTVNIIGCLLIGLLSQLADVRGVITAETRALIITGFLGSFTTFSTFSNDTLNLLRDGKTVLALSNIGTHIAFGLIAVWLGYTIASITWR